MRCLNKLAPNSTSTRVVVCEKVYVRSPPSRVSKIPMQISATIKTSRLDSPRLTSTLSITTWNKSGDTNAKSCKKNEAKITSPNSLRYLTTAGINHEMSNLRFLPLINSRQVIIKSLPFHLSINSSLFKTSGWLPLAGSWIKALSSVTLPRIK